MPNIFVLNEPVEVVQPTSIHAYDTNEFVLQYIPPFLRHAKLVGFLRALLAPLVSYRNRLVLVTYPDIERRARYNSQVIVFEKLLNYEMGYSNGEITIQDGTPVGRIYTSNADEHDPVYFANTDENAPVYVGNATEYITAYDFVVRVPQSLYDNRLGKLKGLVNKYKLAGVNYSVVAY